MATVEVSQDTELFDSIELYLGDGLDNGRLLCSGTGVGTLHSHS